MKTKSESCVEPLDLLTCSRCGADAFVRSCEHGGPEPIRKVKERSTVGSVGPELSPYDQAEGGRTATWRFDAR